MPNEETNYTEAEIKSAMKAIRLLYDELMEDKLMYGEIKIVFHEHMNRYSELSYDLKLKENKCQE